MLPSSTAKFDPAFSSGPSAPNPPMKRMRVAALENRNGIRPVYCDDIDRFPLEGDRS
jgi:hypothetical protein